MDEMNQQHISIDNKIIDEMVEHFRMPTTYQCQTPAQAVQLFTGNFNNLLMMLRDKEPWTFVVTVQPQGSKEKYLFGISIEGGMVRQFQADKGLN
jgi:hypothetical protein